MPAAGPLPAAATLVAIAQAALLVHLDRDDAAHACQHLLSDLAAATGRRAWLDSSPATHARHAPDGSLVLPLQRLGTRMGSLCLHPGADLPPAAGAEALACIGETLAALLWRQRGETTLPGGATTTHSPGGPLIRSALRGAGTFVWEWHIPSDRLGDIDEGFAQLGYPRLPGRRTQDDWNALIHPDDLAANHEAYLRHARGERPAYEHTYRARAADGSWHWLHERGRIVDWTADGEPLRMVGVQADITAQRLAEDLASATTARLSKIAAHVPGALFQYRHHSDGWAHFPYISERCQALFGLAPADLARDAAALLRRVDPARRAAVLDGITAAGQTMSTWQHEFQVQLPDSRQRTIRGTASPQREPDGSLLWHGYFEDVTESRALAQARQGQQLADAANRSKTEFLSRMSHELRTPLNAVLGFAQLMALDGESPLDADQQRRLALIRQSGEHLLAMIEDLLDLTSIEAGRLPLTLEAVPLAELADDALAMVQAAALRQDLRLTREGGDGLVAWADRKRLRQVLINLLSNAVKYNRPGGSVQVQLGAAGGHAVLKVQDTGHGLSAEECAHLFEPFNRLRHAQGPIQGTGIGLTVTRGLVLLMGGAIDVDSMPGVGSCFTVLLPASP